MIHVGIHGRGFINWGGGIGLLEWLITALASQDNIESVFLLPYDKGEHRQSVKDMLLADIPDLRIVEYPDSLDGLRRACQDEGVDILFPCMDAITGSIDIPWVAYVFDFQHKYYPHFFSAGDIQSRERHFQRIADYSKAIIVNSEDTKKDLRAFYHLPEDKASIYRIPFLPSLNKNLCDYDQEDVTKYNLPNEYFIISNQFWMHKDHRTAIEAMRVLDSDSELVNCALVCTGLMEDYRSREYIAELKNVIKEYSLDDKIIMLGYIPKKEQLKIMSQAVAVVQPSLFEGGPGGGETYDALSLGKRVILSDIQVNKEINNDLAVFFHAGSPLELAKKMQFVAKCDNGAYSKKRIWDESRKNEKELGAFLVDLITRVIRDWNK